MEQGKNPSTPLASIRVVQTRWVLVLAACYLVWFSEPGGSTPWLRGSYLAIYIVSAPLLHRWYLRASRPDQTQLRIALFDLFMISAGLILADAGGADFSFIFFFALFVTAIAMDLRAAVGAALLLGFLHLARVSALVAGPLWLHPEILLRLPFLVATALFFGMLAQQQRRRASQLRATEKRRALLKALAAAAHDLRSPLTNIVSLTELLLAGDAGELTREQRDLVERAHADVWRVLHRANNLLDLARLEGGLSDLRRERLDLVSLVRSTANELASIARTRAVELEWTNEADHTTVLADAFQLGRALANVLDNAIKYAPRGSSVRLRVWNPDSRTIRVEICDSGPGIPAEQLPQLFQPYRASGQGRSAVSSGIGLYIARTIIEAHEGTLELHSQVGCGTCVSMALPTWQAQVSQDSAGDD